MNHNGSAALRYELIRQAKAAGADAVKFQLGWRDGEGELNAFSLSEWRDVKYWTDYYEIELFFSVLTHKALEMAGRIGVSRYKVASRTVNTDLGLAEEVLKIGKPTLLSQGMQEDGEIPQRLRDYPNASFLWCKSEYPCFPHHLAGMPNDFKAQGFVGYSDHFLGIEACLLAIARGATVIEKHFTLDKSDSSIRDHVLSADPREFSSMVSLGTQIFNLSNVEVSSSSGSLAASQT